MDLTSSKPFRIWNGKQSNSHSKQTTRSSKSVNWWLSSRSVCCLCSLWCNDLKLSPHVCREQPCNDWVVTWYDTNPVLLSTNIPFYYHMYILGRRATTRDESLHFRIGQRVLSDLKHKEMSNSHLAFLLFCIVPHNTVISSRPNQDRTPATAHSKFYIYLLCLFSFNCFYLYT